MPGNAFGNIRAGEVINGTPEDDILHGTNKDDTISTGRGDDIVFGKGGDDHIEADQLFLPGDDTVFGGRGNDTILLGQGEDVADGGPGDDTITLNTIGPLVPFLTPDGTDTVLFTYASNGMSFGHDTLNAVQDDDVLVFLDKSGKTESLDDLADQTRLVDVGEDAYRIEWLKGDQSVTLHLDNDYLNFGKPPEQQVNWDDFTTLDQLAQVVDFQFDYDFA